MDSGIRSGQDVFKAMALGAKSTFIGRAFVWGLGAAGEAGVTKALQIIRKELDITMGLCGETDITKVGRHNLLMPGWPNNQVTRDREAPDMSTATGRGTWKGALTSGVASSCPAQWPYIGRSSSSLIDALDEA